MLGYGLVKLQRGVLLTSILNSPEVLFLMAASRPMGITFTPPTRSFPLICKLDFQLYVVVRGGVMGWSDGCWLLRVLVPGSRDWSSGDCRPVWRETSE